MMGETGQIFRGISRQYLVVEVVTKPSETEDTLVRLSCLEDDALGESLEVLWEREVDAVCAGETSWETVASRGFDAPKYFSAYLHALRWNCVTSTEPKLFQAPYRAGIEVKAYQLEPLRKALLMPRVGLFIADDVGLGKTIEAGLILREMLMRQKVRRVVISCPPSVVRQWREEMESRFGLTFIILDRQFVASRRQERGYGINPWATHTRFIISHALLRDETYAAPLRDWLGEFCAGSMLILDEAHNAAPASGAKYAVDSQLTRTVREIAPRFEHKLFLSATPHNGHSNSFAALLEMLDSQRFCRGVPVRNRKLLDAVMVRRLKRDLREVGVDDFPKREVIPIVIAGLPKDAVELKLSRLLQEYRHLREERLKNESKSRQAAALLVVTSLQKRLLSSIEAFARTLRVHRQAIKSVGCVAPSDETQHRRMGASNAPYIAPSDETQHRRMGASNAPYSLLSESPGADDERAEFSDEEIQAEEDAEMRAATQVGCVAPLDETQQKRMGASNAPYIAPALTARELELLAEMAEIAGAARFEADSRIKKLVEWIQENLCPDLGKADAAWLDRRVLIFTEYTDTKRYLQEMLQSAIAGSHREKERIEVFHGGIGEDRREAIKLAFNTKPSAHPLRILIATDAAREGVNLQNYCADLFHFDVPWNPSRMEQRNGRIDRKLQRSPVVRCHYFVLPQRAEDRVLDVLVRKTATIQKELGSLTPVVQKNLSRLLEKGIGYQEAESLAASIEGLGAAGDFDSSPHSKIIGEELEAAKVGKAELAKQIEGLRKMLETSQDWLGFDDGHFRDAISASLEILGAKPVEPVNPSSAAFEPVAQWALPALEERFGADPTWSATLDTLRAPRKKGQNLWDWRRCAPVRPVVFRDPGSLDGEVVHLHLEHRLAQRLLGRFLAQGFLHDELTRACVCLTDDPVPKVMGLGRLSLYGERASRLHDEVIAVAAEWAEPSARGRKKLRPLGENEKENVLELLEISLASPRLREVPEWVKLRLRESAAQDVGELIPHLKLRAEELAKRAQRKLAERGKKEAAEMRAILLDQRQQILSREKETEAVQLSLFEEDELRQIEADRRYWKKRLASLERELTDEPVRIEATYQVKAVRVEPVGLVYLYPVPG